MSSGRDGAANRRLSRWSDDPNPGADPAGVEDDRGEDELADVQDDDVVDEETCAESGCTRSAEYSDPAAALGTEGLPSKPLCHSHILDHA